MGLPTSSISNSDEKDSSIVSFHQSLENPKNLTYFTLPNCFSEHRCGSQTSLSLPTQQMDLPSVDKDEKEINNQLHKVSSRIVIRHESASQTDLYSLLIEAEKKASIGSPSQSNAPKQNTPQR